MLVDILAVAAFVVILGAFCLLYQQHKMWRHDVGCWEKSWKEKTKEANKDWDDQGRQNREILYQLTTRLEKWLMERGQIMAAKRFLVGADWRSSAGKHEFVQALYGDKVPMYLWYELPTSALTQEELAMLDELLGRDREVYRDDSLGPGYLMRVRDPKQFVAEFELRGQKCPLRTVGHYGSWGFESDSNGTYVNFPELFSPDKLKLSHRLPVDGKLM